MTHGGQVKETGIDKQVLEQMGDAVPPSKAGWFLLIGHVTEDKYAFGAKKHEK